MKIDTAQFRAEPGAAIDLRAIPTSGGEDGDRDEAERQLSDIREQLGELQEKLFAERRQSLLIVLQGMDTAGKDSTMRSVLSSLNPQGVRVWNFKAPSTIEREHDFLWRVHRHCPGDGYIGVFNRSHYEDVLIARVKNLVPKKRWQARYEHINAFETLLSDEGTRIVKFFLHISKAYQKRRLQRRLDRPDKRWKFNPADLVERALWDDYTTAYEQAITRCSTAHAPWYIIPAERRWFRNVVIASVVRETLAAMNPRVPEVQFDPGEITIED